jgi:signal transduction histidine kinase
MSQVIFDPSKYVILIVDDTHQNVQVLSQILRDEKYVVLGAFSAEDGLNLIEKRRPHLILMDVMMPGMNGYDATKIIKDNPETANIPILFLSALSDAEAKVKAFEAGGIDYITKPFQHQEVLARVRIHLRIYTLEVEREKNITELTEKQNHLEKLNKEKDDVLAIISHDMRNPLGGIIGISNFLQLEEIEDRAEMQEMLRLIESSAERLLALVNDLLDVAVIEANTIRLEFVDVDLEKTVSDVISLQTPAAKSKAIRIITQFDEKLPTIEADQSKMSQILGNLISNAIKFTPNGGEISIQAMPDSSNNVKIVISDSGIGIPADLMGSLFTKMGRHQRVGTSGEKGTGLGMPIIKRYVEVHNGTIMVDSTVDEGSVFTICLPIHQTL